MQASPNILVVEDEWLIAEAMRALFEELGFANVRCCHDLKSAFDAVDAQRVDVALMDVNLASEVVFPLAERLRDAGVAIIFATALAADRFPANWQSCRIIGKPVTRDVLTEALAAYGIP